jgi:hypothetical protein
LRQRGEANGAFGERPATKRDDAGRTVGQLFVENLAFEGTKSALSALLERRAMDVPARRSTSTSRSKNGTCARSATAWPRADLPLPIIPLR